MHDIAIIGSGPAGLSAALYGARAGRSILLFEGPVPGGQLTKTHDGENYPGRPRVGGSELVMSMREQLNDLIARDQAKIEIVSETVEDLTRMARGWTLNGTRHAKTVILATGSTPRRLGVPGEDEFENKGVSWCAVCDGMFYRGKDVAVIGGGNSALEEAIYLANICRSVTLIHRRDTFRADAMLQARLKTVQNIRLVLKAHVTCFDGDKDGLKGVGVISAGQNDMIDVKGAFIAIGHEPQSQLIWPFAEIDAHGYVVTAKGDHIYQTVAMRRTADGIGREPALGLHIAGDTGDSVYRQAITSAGTGCMAALDASRYIETMQALSSRPRSLVDA